MVDIGRDYLATVKRYNGWMYLDIRRHYKPSGEENLTPGVPGMSLSQSQWGRFKAEAPEVVTENADQEIDLVGDRAFGKYN